jgi:thiol:disulfide interchange protein DsbA
MEAKKKWLNIILPIAGIAIVFLYMICEGSCEYLEGSLMGLSLHYLGIIYMGILLIAHLLKKLEVSLFLLSSGLGAEVQLLAFQIQNDVFCSYCLSFGAVILVLFLLNFERSRKIFISVSLVLGLILFAIFFKGSATPAYAEDIVVPSFGSGKTQVRLYTDYFCKPCRALEPSIEPLIINLVEKESITITFIDTPIHPQTTLYAKYFLYILNENKEFKHALHARSVLFEAAKAQIKQSEKLEAFIKKEGLSFKPFNTEVTLKIFSDSLKKDKIKATPTCVIYKGGKRETFTGHDIKSALEKLE